MDAWGLIIGFISGAVLSWYISSRYRVFPRQFVAEYESKFFFVDGKVRKPIPDTITRLVLELEFGRAAKPFCFEIPRELEEMVPSVITNGVLIDSKTGQTPSTYLIYDMTGKEYYVPSPVLKKKLIQAGIHLKSGIDEQKRSWDARRERYATGPIIPSRDWLKALEKPD